jgi:uncharacterized protein (DUF2252 family)
VKIRPQDRQRTLLARQKLKMARSSHAYVRGSTVKFYEWLREVKPRSLPDGPAIWICGDCHLGNLGPVADADGHVAIQIRDLDQTVIGNPAHDIIRLGLSLASAARSSDLPGVTTAHMLEQIILGYTAALSPTSRKKPAMTQPIEMIFREALRRKWRHLAKERLEDVEPTIPLGSRFWAIDKKESAALKNLFSEDPVRQLITGLHHRPTKAPVRLLDAAYWMKGCSSLGKLRYATLIEVSRTKRDTSRYCLMDIKEAVKAAAPCAPHSTMPHDYAERVVTGARALSPNLGERMLATHLLGQPVVLRELLPQDLKLELTRLTPTQAVQAAHFLASVVGRAHARQMNAATARSWKKEILRQRSRNLDAPSWLWSSVVELLSIHELAYLEHCRRYALAS